MLKKIMLLAALSISVVACGGGGDEEATPNALVKVKSLQKNDKNLSCREILLEMNEAQFYNKMAHKNRGVKLKSVLMPLGYISTYMDSEDAINAAQARVEYLDRIYEIMHCEDQEKELEKLPVFQGNPSGSQKGEPHSQYQDTSKQYSDSGNSVEGVRYYLEK